LSQHTYNEMFTMHGSLMIYLFVAPVAFGGLANYIVPLQIGGHGVPETQRAAYWLYLGRGSGQVRSRGKTGDPKQTRPP
jgi:cytochrome c oxidase subunit 1